MHRSADRVVMQCLREHVELIKTSCMYGTVYVDLDFLDEAIEPTSIGLNCTRMASKADDRLVATVPFFIHIFNSNSHCCYAL